MPKDSRIRQEQKWNNLVDENGLCPVTEIEGLPVGDMDVQASLAKSPITLLCSAT